LIEPLADEQLNTVYSPILSPLAWDLGHIANFEELWLVQRVGEREPLRGELGRFYDAIENPRKIRNELPILRGDELRSYMADVRERTLDVLGAVELEDTDERLLAGGFVYEMLLAHEHQHNETMLQLLQMVDGYEPVRVDASVAAEPVSEGPEMVTVPVGEYEIGAGDEGFAYDNERPRHRVELDAFEIDRTPVTNGAFAEFLADTGSEPPMYWERDGDGWVTTVFGRREPVDPALPRGPRRLAPGRRVRGVGRQAAADRVRVGGGGGRRRSRARQPRPARFRMRTRRRLRRRPRRLRRGADAR
jgi:iron(II)-dependent oxidoreductase